MIQRTCVIIKPDGIRRNLVDEIISRYEKEGLKVIAKKEVTANDELLSKHYSAHEGKKFYESLKKFMMSGPVMAMILEGEDAVAHVRKITGATDPPNADKGTIRSDLGIDIQAKADSEGRALENLVHASGTPEEAKKEVKLWFPDIE